MINIFEYLDNYTKRNCKTYGSIGKNNEDIIKEILSPEEYEEYRNIKQSNLNRLKKFS